jgi:predicted RNase H-like HicB family nuclease
LDPAAKAEILRYIGASQHWDRVMARPIVVHADWDPEAAVWVATTQDLRGLVTEAESIEALRAKLPGMILDLLEETGTAFVPSP